MLLYNIQKPICLNYILSHYVINDMITYKFDYNDEEVIDYYIEGNRGKYFTPGRFFVTIFAIAAIIMLFKPETQVTLDQDQVMQDLKDFMQNPISSNIMLLAALIILPLGLISKILFYKSHYNLAMHYVAQIYCYCSIYFSFTIVGIFNSILFKKFNILTTDTMEESEDFSKSFVEFMASDGILILYPLFLLMIFILPFIYYTSALRNIFKKNYIHSFIKSIIIVTTIVIMFMLILAAHLYLMYDKGMIPQDYFWIPD